MNLDSLYLDGVKLWDCADPSYGVGLTSENLGSGPEPRVSSEGRPQGDGSVNRTRYWGPRLVELVGYVQGASRADRTLGIEELRNLFTLRADHVLTFTPADGIARQLAVVVASKFDAPVDGDPGVLEWAVTLEAPDPRLYRTTPIVISNTASGTLAATNTDRAPTPVVLSLHGPATTLALITNTTTGETLAFNDATLGGSDVLVVDTGARTVTLNGAAAPQLIDTPANTWLELQPGPNVLSVTGTGFTGATILTATYREAQL